MAIKYKWLADQLEQLYAKQQKSGQVSAPAQDKFPTERVLAARYHVSRQTVRSALKLLEEKGIIKKVQGSGTYLTGKLGDPAKNQILLILHEEPEFFSSRLCQSLSLSLAESGFSLLCKASRNSFETERELLTALLQEPPRGLFIQPVKNTLPNPNRDLYHLLIKKGCHIVFLFSSCPEFPEVPCICYDDHYGCSMLVQKLLAQGHMRIGALFQSDDRASQERYLSFMETMQQAGMPVPDRHVSWYDSVLADRICGRRPETGLFSRLIPDGFSDCTALICDHDGVLWRLQQELAAPQTAPGRAARPEASGNTTAKAILSECISFGGFLHGHLSERQKRTHTLLLHSDPETLGTLAAQTLLDSIKGLPVQSREIPWKLS